jgi:hypothetical protein
MVRITKLVFDGNAEEFASVADLFRGDALEDLAAAPEQLGGAPDAEARLIRRVLTRRKPVDGQVALYRALAAADGSWLSLDQLASATGRRPRALTGVLGALGRRVNATPGIAAAGRVGAGIALLLDLERRESGWHYRLRPATRDVLKDLQQI